MSIESQVRFSNKMMELRFQVARLFPPYTQKGTEKKLKKSQEKLSDLIEQYDEIQKKAAIDLSGLAVEDHKVDIVNYADAKAAKEANAEAKKAADEAYKAAKEAGEKDVKKVKPEKVEPEAHQMNCEELANAMAEAIEEIDNTEDKKEKKEMEKAYRHLRKQAMKSRCGRIASSAAKKLAKAKKEDEITETKYAADPDPVAETKVEDLDDEVVIDFTAGAAKEEPAQDFMNPPVVDQVTFADDISKEELEALRYNFEELIEGVNVSFRKGKYVYVMEINGKEFLVDNGSITGMDKYSMMVNVTNGQQIFIPVVPKILPDLKEFINNGTPVAETKVHQVMKKFYEVEPKYIRYFDFTGMPEYIHNFTNSEKKTFLQNLDKIIEWHNNELMTWGTKSGAPMRPTRFRFEVFDNPAKFVLVSDASTKSVPGVTADSTINDLRINVDGDKIGAALGSYYVPDFKIQ